jgi:hypothetical protein
MTSRPGYRTGRGLLRLAVAGAVAVGTPIALAGNAEAAPSSVWDKVAQCESGGYAGLSDLGRHYIGGLLGVPGVNFPAQSNAPRSPCARLGSAQRSDT